jgi:ApaG protein
MPTATTQGLKVSVITQYQEQFSNTMVKHFVFAYRVKIENTSDFTVKLLRRHWFIADSNGHKQEVEGEGVVGQNPILEPGQVYEYTSGTSFSSPIGKMFGTYLMERIVDGKQFNISIPEFVMSASFKLN